MAVLRYFIKLAYEGTDYHGWQIQENAHTIQAELNEKLAMILQVPIETTGCGRTDAGVHAKEFYAHFDVQEKADTGQLLVTLNKILPPAIGVSGLFQVNEEAHTRYSAVARTYQYHIVQEKDPFRQHRAHYYYEKLDIELMNQAARVLLEHSDFTSFSKTNTQVKTNICNVMQAEWTRDSGVLLFTITADRFLRNMVRAIVGSLLEVGKGKASIDDFRQVIERKNRSEAGMSVPAAGLYLSNVEYPTSIRDLS